MESSLYLSAAVIVLLVVGWLIFKFFFRLLKHFIFAVILATVVALFWYQQPAPRKDPNLGKFAYGTISNGFLGVVVADDKANGNWIIEKSGGIKMKYPKNRVILKDP